MGKYDHVKIDGIQFKPGERWFLIRGQDRFAPAAIDAYAGLVESSVPAAMVTEVRQVVEQVRQWQRAIRSSSRSRTDEPAALMSTRPPAVSFRARAPA
jgi:hypothetical protein